MAFVAFGNFSAAYGKPQMHVFHASSTYFTQDEPILNIQNLINMNRHSLSTRNLSFVAETATCSTVGRAGFGSGARSNVGLRR
jgi:hypothetical protein